MLHIIGRSLLYRMDEHHSELILRFNFGLKSQIFSRSRLYPKGGQVWMRGDDK